MRLSPLLACIPLAIFAAAACASSDDEAPPSDPDGGGPSTLDATTVDASPDVEVDATLPVCSPAGWCTTALPDVELRIRDIWPLPGRAFAIAESPTLGAKILEWRDGDAKWGYIDDNTQNEVGGQYAGTIWAPSDDEVYFGVAPAYIFHGIRRAPPDSGWTWSRARLEDNSHKGELGHEHDHGYPMHPNVWAANYPALGVWGTGSGDVYAWYSNTVYHWKNDGWVAEYIANDPASTWEHLYFVSAGGSGADDVWFSGGRTASFSHCALLVRKGPDGFRRVADGLIGDDGCGPRAGTSFVGGTQGWLTDIQSAGAGRLVGLKGSQDIARISVEGASPVAALFPVPTFPPVGNSGTSFRSFWSSDSDVWLSGWGLIVRGPSVGNGSASDYGVSTISLNGAPISRPMHKVRGSSNTNLWAIGNGYAFHKTTP